jgi:drug/metabolite transporter (DMT)-like permease
MMKGCMNYMKTKALGIMFLSAVLLIFIQFTGFNQVLERVSLSDSLILVAFGVLWLNLIHYLLEYKPKRKEHLSIEHRRFYTHTKRLQE